MAFEDESELLVALRRRDGAAFTHLFETHADRIFRLAVGVLEDEVQAEGVVQDTFMALIERLDQFEGRSQIGTWLYRIAYNKGIDRLRRNRPQAALDETLDDEALLPAVLVDWRAWPEALLADAERADALDKAIAALAEPYRTVFLLREVERFSTEETARIVGIAPGAVKVRLHRARLFLRERLSETLAEYAPG